MRCRLLDLGQANADIAWRDLKAVTKPYEFIGFGAMDVTKPYKFIGLGAMDVTRAEEVLRL